MLRAFFESVKYVGHLIPLAFLRIYMGYTYFSLAMTRFQGDFLTRPRFASTISEGLIHTGAPVWYQNLLESYVIPYWKFFAYVLAYSEYFVGMSLILGFLVRPASLVGLFWALNFIYVVGGIRSEVYELHLVFFITLLWFGGGRCLGFDYFFYKRQRGLWW